MGKHEVDNEFLSRMNMLGFNLFYSKEDDTVCIVNQHGDMMDKKEVMEVIKGLFNFLEVAEDDDIVAFNRKPSLYTDYSRSDFDRTRRIKSKKNGYVFLYKELASNTYRFGETKDFHQRQETLINSSPVALDFVFKMEVNDTFRHKEFLQEKFLHRKVENNWYELTPEDVESIRSKELVEEFEEYAKALEQKMPVESFVCGSCDKKVTDRTHKGYYHCRYCEAKFDSEECVIEHFKHRHLHR